MDGAVTLDSVQKTVATGPDENFSPTCLPRRNPSPCVGN